MATSQKTKSARRSTNSDTVRIGVYWEDRLDEWLAELRRSPKDRNDVQDWSFPTDTLRGTYLADIEGRSEEEVVWLLRIFLYKATNFGAISTTLDTLLQADPKTQKQLLKGSEYYGRILRAAIERRPFFPGNRWILDLLPAFPKAAIEVLEAYYSPTPFFFQMSALLV